jgi:O-antigen ligase
MAIAMAVFFTYFRTNWIMFILQIILVLLFKRRQIKTVFSILALVVPVIVFVILTNKYAIETRIDDFYYLEEENPQVQRRVGSGRFGIWEDNINAFARAPVFTKMIGRGLGGSASIAGGRMGHNDFIDILSNNGLVGLFIYLWFLFTLFRIGRLLLRTATSAFHRDIAFLFWIVFISWLARAMLTGTVFNPNGMWYIAAAFGITCVATRIRDNGQRYPLEDKE